MVMVKITFTNFLIKFNNVHKIILGKKDIIGFY